jgi:hypothetical protein
MSFHRLLLLVLLCVSASTPSVAQQIPAGTALPIRSSKGLESTKAKAGDRIAGKLMQDVVLASGEKIRTGARVEGTVVDSSVQGSAPARVTVRFDRLVTGNQQFVIKATLRALASMEEVFAAQLPWNTFDDYGTSSSDWSTVQVGGAAVYRGDGTVRSAMEVVGHATDFGAVTAQLMPAPRRGCPGSPMDTDREQSLWVVSPWACGTYGFEGLAIAQIAAMPPGTIELTSTKAINVRAGSGWLLVTLAPAGAGAPSATN